MKDLLAALQHADSAFPSGSFAFSNGLEGLAAQGAALDRDALPAVVAAIIRHRWAPADRVALVHAHRAGSELPAIAAIDREFEAATLIESFRVGSRRNGGALLAAHTRLGTTGAVVLREAIASGDALGHLAIVQGFVWRALGIAIDEAVAMSGYTTAAGLLTACVRLGTIGALDAQTVLASALAVVAEEAARPVPDDAPIASFLPWIDIAAARNARAHVRLFAS